MTNNPLIHYSSYPILLIPECILNIIKLDKEIFTSQVLNKMLGEYPQEPISPKKPIEPYLPSNRIDYNLRESKSYLKKFIAVIVLLILYALAFNLGSPWKDFNYDGLIWGSFFAALPALYFLISALIFYGKYEDDKTAYQNGMVSYNKKQLLYEEELEEYEKKYDLYKIEYELFEKKLEEYRNKEEELRSDPTFQAEVQILRNEEIHKSLLYFGGKVSIPKPNPIEFQSGISEKYFLQYLQKYFWSISIIQQSMLEYYEPDFILELNNGLRIDIEIDEPYSGKTKECTHYYDYEKNSFSDAKRNRFFVENRWIVIRFAEQQIIEHPDSCCKFIAELLLRLDQYVTVQPFNNTPDIKTMEIWSKKKSGEMAYFDIRKQYLPDKLIKKIIKDENVISSPRFSDLHPNKKLKLDQTFVDSILANWEEVNPFEDQNFVAPNPNPTMVDRILNSWQKANPLEDEDEFEPEL